MFEVVVYLIYDGDMINQSCIIMASRMSFKYNISMFYICHLIDNRIKK